MAVKYVPKGKIEEKQTAPEVVTPVEQYVEKPVNAIPVFDHKGNVSVEESKLRKSLLQGGHRFSFGELNHATGRFVPEPRFIQPGRVAGNELMDRMNAMMKIMGELESKLRDMRTDILNNMDLIVAGG